MVQFTCISNHFSSLTKCLQIVWSLSSDQTDQTGADQGLGAQQTAVINLTGMGGFMSSQAAGMADI